MNKEPTITKESNPKESHGVSKAALSLVPLSFMALVATALHNGRHKYGLTNWRHGGASASVYLDACLRHVMAYAEGQEVDPDDGVPHLAAAAACLAILIDSSVCGTLNDTRGAKGSDSALHAPNALTKMLNERHKGRTGVVDYTINGPVPRQS